MAECMVLKYREHWIDTSTRVGVRVGGRGDISGGVIPCASWGTHVIPGVAFSTRPAHLGLTVGFIISGNPSKLL